MSGRLIGGLIVIAVCVAAGPAGAVIKNWNDGTSNWSTDANWTPAGVPGNLDIASIVFADGAARTVTYDYTGPLVGPIGIDTLNVDLTNAGANATTFSMPANTFTALTEKIGVNGVGTFNQSGGSNNMFSSSSDYGLWLGYAATGVGNYNLSGGSLYSTLETVGLNGQGAFTQTAGSNVVPGQLIVGSGPAAKGTYTLSGGILQPGVITVGLQATGGGGQSGGLFTQSGGTVSAYEMNLGSVTGSTGTYMLNGGSLNLTSYLECLTIGWQGTGTFVQTGGSLTANRALIGLQIGSSGSFLLSGGTATVADLSVGCGNPGGFGTMTVSGTNTILNLGTLAVSGAPGSVFSLQSGTVNVATIDVGGDPSRFSWTGGTLNFTKDVTFDTGGPLFATTNIFGPAFSLSSSRTLTVTGNETIGGSGVFNLSVGSGIHTVSGNITLKAGGSISQSNTGTIGYTNFTQTGGTISTFFRNNTNFTYEGGSITAQFVNDGTMTLGSNLTISNSFQNDALMTVAAGRTFTATSGITNLGNFVVAGGTIGQSSPFTNSIGGTLTAHGTINPTITNHGTLVVDGVLSLGTSLTNDGIVQGAGTVNLISTFSNNAGGVINATNAGSALSFTNLVNSAGSAVNVGPSSTLSITGNWTNSGIVNLQGFGSRLSGGTITNNGLIQGFGSITATLGTSNSGVFRASGGELDFTAASVTNSSQSQFQILAGSTAMFLQGMTSNSGTISLMGGTFDNNSHTLQNNGTINGYGTLRTSTLTNSSGRLISVGEGNMDVVGSVINNGVFSIQSGRSAYFFGPVSGSGGFTGTGTAVFLASLSPGNSPALVNFGGGATLAGGTSLVMELGGSAAGSGYDKIDVEGQLSIGGVLSVSLINGFTPAAWSSFDLLDWGSLAGTFSSISLPALPVGQWDTSKLYVDGTLSVSLLGDFDHSGVVTAADYVVWRKGLGTIYSPSDFDVWRAHYGEGGNGSGSAIVGAAVPEPGTAMLWMMAMVFEVLRRLGRRNASHRAL